jgi:DNA (cytosine-5)-methyltransferase 1
MDRIVGPYDQQGVRETLLICDLFCGAGGFTTGAMRALRALGLHAVMAAVNHWPVAIATHNVNHPHVRHYIEDVKAANPRDIVPEGYLDVLLCSPSCVFYSRARGGKPSSDQQRMDPEAIIRWIDELDVRVLIAENVPEITAWCRIDPRTGRPMKGYKGEYFRRWIRRIEARGYRVEWRVLTCADYGDPTSRQRWFMIARKDGVAITWPPQTHAKNAGFDAAGRPLPRWRGAVEIIDWSDHGTSIFGRRPRRKGYKAPKASPKQLRALAYNTLRRVKAGTDRFTGPWKAVFAAAIEEEMALVGLDEAGLDRPDQRALLTFRWCAESGAVAVEPVDAKVAFQPGELLHLPNPSGGLVLPALRPDPYLVMLYGTNTVRAAARPVPAVTASGQHIAVTQASVAGSHPFTCANRSKNAPRSLLHPVAPVLTGTGGGIWLADAAVDAYMLSQQSGGAPRTAHQPIPSVATDGAIALVVPALDAAGTAGLIAAPVPLRPSQYLVAVNHGDGPGQNNGRRVRDVTEPLQGVTGSRGTALLDPAVHGLPPHELPGYTAAFFGSNVARRSSTAALAHPLGAVTTRARYGFCVPRITPYLVPQFGERPGQAPRIHRVDLPAPAVTSHGAGALVVPLLVRFDHAGAGGACVRSTSDPVWTHTSKVGCGLAESYIISPRHSRLGGGPAPRHVGSPVPTLTGGGSQVGVVQARAAREQLKLDCVSSSATEPESLELRLHDQPAAPRERIAPAGGRMVWVDGVLIRIDVAFRMLRNRELARSHSFDDDESEYEFVGTQAEQTKQVGNSVPVATAQALVLSQIRAIPGVLSIESARVRCEDRWPGDRYDDLQEAA